MAAGRAEKPRHVHPGCSVRVDARARLDLTFLIGSNSKAA